jgi:HAD superfamily hydrolase (TIGR01509 family)
LNKEETMQHITHIIWDCDGCLIDSEIIACRIEAEAFTKFGYPTTTEDYIRHAFETDLRPIPGINETLTSLKLPMAVASGSSPERLEHSLKLTGLWEHFQNHIYSSTMVKNGKPAPDVFLLAAEKLNANPQNCLVIEDGSWCHRSQSRRYACHRFYRRVPWFTRTRRSPNKSRRQPHPERYIPPPQHASLVSMPTLLK